ncbi:DUF1365 family protein [Senna tora]|uniref:DUF1365 family protein n=1 Tax=Senna tora TaxID=362788 RepID=A0A834SGR0_9FABA|nr:DUF1365 family protein [Senna tora]
MDPNPYLSTKALSGTNAAVPSTTPSSTTSATRSLILTMRLTRLPTIFPPIKLAKLLIPPDPFVDNILIGFEFGNEIVISYPLVRMEEGKANLLLTIPPSVGYEQNPLSLYYCYDVEGSCRSLKKCIAEVTNTPWGERVSFIFNPHSDLVAKALHVSPFMDMLGSWNIKASDPGDNLTVAISVHHPELGNYFTATLKAKKLSSPSDSDHAVFFWLMPHKVAVWIYWHALKLWWKNVRFVQHPRYAIPPTYREEALIRDRKLQCCGSMGFSGDHKHVQQRGTDQGFSYDINSSNRWFKWRDAKWPWS